MVGNGSKINIWKDPWLPNHNGFKIWTPKPSTTHHNLVQDLIDQDSLTWKSDTIEELFFSFWSWTNPSNSSIPSDTRGWTSLVGN